MRLWGRAALGQGGDGVGHRSGNPHSGPRWRGFWGGGKPPAGPGRNGALPIGRQQPAFPKGGKRGKSALLALNPAFLSPGLPPAQRCPDQAAEAVWSFSASSTATDQFFFNKRNSSLKKRGRGKNGGPGSATANPRPTPGEPVGFRPLRFRPRCETVAALPPLACR